MRFLFRVSLPVEAANASARKDGFRAIQSILEQQKPETAYFLTEHGRRTAFLFMNLADASEIPAICEPWFLALHALIEITPVMTPDDLHRAGPAIAQAVEAYG